jgi:putative ABC transport system ATP-binding protein
MSIVDVKHVSKVFGSGHAAVKAVDDVSLTIEPGDIVLIMGPSGSGKTTLLSIIGTLMKATEGEVSVDGKIISNLPDNELAALRLREFGFIFQAFNLLSALNAEENITVPLLAAGVSKQKATGKAKQSYCLRNYILRKG